MMIGNITFHGIEDVALVEHAPMEIILGGETRISRRVDIVLHTEDGGEIVITAFRPVEVAP